MNTYYVVLDSDGYISEAPVLEAEEGKLAIQVGDDTKEYLLRYYTKYRVSNGNLLGPGNLPSIEIDTLLNAINEQKGQIEAQSEQLATAQGTIRQLQMIEGNLVQQQTALADSVTKNAESTKALQGAASLLMQKVTLLTQQGAGETTTTTTVAPTTTTTTVKPTTTNSTTTKEDAA